MTEFVYCLEYFLCQCHCDFSSSWHISGVKRATFLCMPDSKHWIMTFFLADFIDAYFIDNFIDNSRPK